VGDWFVDGEIAGYDDGAALLVLNICGVGPCEEEGWWSDECSDETNVAARSGCNVVDVVGSGGGGDSVPRPSAWRVGESERTRDDDVFSRRRRGGDDEVDDEDDDEEEEELMVCETTVQY
jgi:hypothetical protein